MVIKLWARPNGRHGLRLLHWDVLLLWWWLWLVVSLVRIVGRALVRSPSEDPRHFFRAGHTLSLILHFAVFSAVERLKLALVGFGLSELQRG